MDSGIEKKVKKKKGNLRNKIELLILLLMIVIVGGTYFILQLKADKTFALNYINAEPSANETTATSSNDKISLLMFGDMVAAPPLRDEIINNNVDPFGPIHSEFVGKDLIIGNLETTIDGPSFGSPQDKPYVETSPKKFLQFIHDAGITDVTNANNHAKDYGPNALLYDLYTTNQSGIKIFGTGADDNSSFKPVIENVKGTKIAFLGFDSAEYALNKSSSNEAGTAWFSNSLTDQAIRDAKSQADIVIVFPHWGDEHVPNNNALQYEWGRKFIDAGADMVVGAHPHVRQNYEQYNGKWIFYSLGNFVTQGMDWDPEGIIGYILEVNVKDKKIQDFQLKDVKLDMFGMPSLK